MARSQSRRRISMNCPDQKFLDEIFPPDRADAFFDAIYGGAEDGAYDIALVCQGVKDNVADLAFELRRREGHCLKCSLTYGLPNVFQRHPLLNVAGVAKAVAEKLGWQGAPEWELMPVEEISDDLHIIPLRLEKAK